MSSLPLDAYIRDHAAWFAPRLGSVGSSRPTSWQASRRLLGRRLLELRYLLRVGALRGDTHEAPVLAQGLESVLAVPICAEVADPLARIIEPAAATMRDVDGCGYLEAIVATCFEREEQIWTEQFTACVDEILAACEALASLHGGDPVGRLLDAYQKKGDRKLHIRFEVSRVGEQAFQASFETTAREVITGDVARSKALAKRSVASKVLSQMRRAPRSPTLTAPDGPAPDILPAPDRSETPAEVALTRARDFDRALPVHPLVGEALAAWFHQSFERRPWETVNLLSRHTHGAWRIDGWRAPWGEQKLALVRIRHHDETWFGLGTAKSSRKVMYAATREAVGASNLIAWLDTLT